MPIEWCMLTPSMEGAQKKVGTYYYAIRWQMFEYEFLEMMTLMRRNVIYSMFMFQAAPAPQGAGA